MKCVVVGTVWLLLASTLQAQITYNAGNAGNPPTAPSPTTQGWTESISGSCSVRDVSPDPDAPVNAWQITDPGPGYVLYSTDFNSGTQYYYAEVVMRPLADELYFEIDAGDLIPDNVFKVALRLVGPDVHVVELNSLTTLVCPGGADGYHTYNFQSGSWWSYATVSFDGVVVGSIPFSSWGLGGSLPGGGLHWGTRDPASGRARVTRAWMGLAEPCSFKTSVYCTAKVNSQGCTPAIGWTGSPSASHVTPFRIRATNVINKSPGILIYSRDGSASVPFQGGWLCVGNVVRRTPASSSGGNPGGPDCSGVFSFEFNDYIASGKDPGLTVNKNVWAQYWYRDAQSATGSGLSDALMFQICP